MCIHLGGADAGADAARVFAFVRSRKFWLLILERRRSARLCLGMCMLGERSNYLEICGAAYRLLLLASNLRGPCARQTN
jgi:hypothetical protein